MRLRFWLLFAALLVAIPAFASPLVTGNGFGFAVVSPESAALRRFYAHPYSYGRPDPKELYGEGIPTANFLKAMGWHGEATNVVAEYVDDSHVIHARSSAGEMTVFMPFGLRQSVVIARWQPEASNHAAIEVQWAHEIGIEKSVMIAGVPIEVFAFQDVEESLLMIPLEERRGKGWLERSNAWALVSMGKDADVTAVVKEFQEWRGGLSAKELAKRELAEVEHWRVKPPAQLVGEQERRLWRQSEMVLRMGQSREPNRPGRYGNGLIVACLPDGSFSNTWVRDMAFATVALARMGHREEARVAVMAYFNAQPTGKMRKETGGLDYQISVVRYWGDGAEEPFFTMEGAPNIEYDSWALALWALGEYVSRYDDAALLNEPSYRGTVYESAKDFIVKPLEATFEKYGDGLIVAKDTSIWEEHQPDKKHFAWSTALAIVGLKSYAEMAKRAGDDAGREDALKKAGLLQKGFDAAFIRDGKLHGTLEEGIKNDIDGALLAIINFGVVKDPAIIRSTVERMELLKVTSGGYRRVRGTYTDPAIYEYWYEQEEFLFVDFSLAQVLRNLGQKEKAAAIVERMVQKSAKDHNFVPEMYVAVDCKLFHGAIGDPTGAIPMVGYGAGVFVMEVLSR
ncbi:glycoside hydrolase family 15 [Candidatus Korobacter versatilis]|nr:glycoside hydrolase family 15 [Candidatus Koribacter versatilis]